MRMRSLLPLPDPLREERCFPSFLACWQPSAESLPRNCPNLGELPHSHIHSPFPGCPHQWLLNQGYESQGAPPARSFLKGPPSLEHTWGRPWPLVKLHRSLASPAAQSCSSLSFPSPPLKCWTQAYSKEDKNFLHTTQLSLFPWGPSLQHSLPSCVQWENHGPILRSVSKI